MARQVQLTGVERMLGANKIIVSKTDLKGRLTYVNHTFLDIAGYTEAECIGQPHNMIRHPEMPRCIFQLLWEEIQARREVFAYVVNRCKAGDHYWVYAHVTPSVDLDGRIVGFHSNRRVPNRKLVADTIVPLYAELRAEERRHANDRDGLKASRGMLQTLLDDRGMAYPEFIQTLGRPGRDDITPLVEQVRAGKTTATARAAA